MNPPPQRSQAIDVLRGMTLALMIVVNMSISEAKSYGQLLHATWHGFTLTDLVFPTFLFVVGNSLAFTLDRYQTRGDGALLRKVAGRVGLIFLCGFLLYWFPFVRFDEAGGLALLPLDGARILGVLQRIALTYGLAALLLHYGRWPAALLFSLVALLGHWWVLATFGDYSLAGNAALKLDRLVLGENHLYRGEGIPFDPEGLLGTLPATVHVLAGYFAGRVVRFQGARLRPLAGLALAGLACLALGLAWDGLFPINKKLWTSSYVVFSIGIDLLLLAALAGLIDGLGRRGWTPFFEILGRNTLFLYLLSELAGNSLWLARVGDQSLFLWLYETGFAGWAGPRNGSLLFALAFLACCWLVGYGLDRRRIYIRL